ncbi:MAG: hypothetical protein U1E60_22705 [Reyranellaceae bacterium]
MRQRSGARVARDIDKKLRLTAALLGAVTCKDLAATFRNINKSTSFDVDRAYKWLQGRARPRERQVYEDWAKVLDLDRPGDWIAECDTDAFLEQISARHQRDPEALRRRAEASIVIAGDQEQPDAAVTGLYACYSHAWSPYFQGRLIRGELSITLASNPRRLFATYAERLPTGRMQLEGPVSIGKRLMSLEVRERGGDSLLFLALFPPSSPVSVLGGLLTGATMIGPDSQPSVSRIALIRLPPASAGLLREHEAYLPAHASIAQDLARLGLPIADPATVDQRLQAFLAGGGGGLDQIALTTYGALVELFDRTWLTHLATAAA